MPISTKKYYVCKNCGFSSAKWQGQCPSCKQWNSFLLTEFKEPRKAAQEIINIKKNPLSEIEINSIPRIKTKIQEFDRVLGGGIVPGSVTIIGGDPGIGKSTLMLQVAFSTIKDSLQKVLYASGEESLEQIKLRAERLGINSSSINLLNTTKIEEMEYLTSKEKPDLLIVDSIQTATSDDFPSQAGSILQVRGCASRLIQIAKKEKIAVFIIGHITKGGEVAGPKALEHMVDTVLYFSGDKNQVFRVLRITKNRFGPTSEIGIFEMKNSGLRQVKNVSRMFLKENGENIGVAHSVITEGTRSFLVEIQALTNSTFFPYPKRTALGIDLNRLQLLSAVICKHLKINLSNKDIYLNIAGGLKTEDRAIDLAISLAIVSSAKDRKIIPKTVILGELGLSQEVKPVSQLDNRIKEAEQMGFVFCICPQTIKTGKIQIKKATSLEQAVKIAFK